MALVWKLLRQHASIPQFVGFFLANLAGMTIILLGTQFYTDIQSVYDGEDSFMKKDYLIVNKEVGTLAAITGKDNGFGRDEIDELLRQPFAERVGAFTSSTFDVRATFDVQQFMNFSTDMFFESVPDEFVDARSSEWAFREDAAEIPIILPRNYLDLYNFGYAQSRSMPKLSEGILGAMKLKVTIAGGGQTGRYDGKIVGFSSRLNTILVPQSFMEWANKRYSGKPRKSPMRLILQVKNPADERIAAYLQEHGYATDQDKLAASKTTFVLRVVTAIVMSVGLVISALAFYILMLSIYLLVQKNSDKLENLLLIGYSPARVALPYQLLTIGLNVLVLAMAVAAMLAVRSVYTGMFRTFFPDFQPPATAVSLMVGAALLCAVSALNVAAVRAKILSIWKRKE